MKITFSLAISLLVTAGASADIYQWMDGDGDGSLWLTAANAAPFSDFSGQTLWWADLFGANVMQSNFSNTNLYAANMMATNLFGSTMTSANLSTADLTWSNLTNTQLESADLSFATLMGANLYGADLSFANMNGANVSYATIFFADTTNTDLSGVIGWELASWTGTIYDVNTVFASGMDPDAVGMVFVPVPSVLALLTVAGFGMRRRRS